MSRLNTSDPIEMARARRLAAGASTAAADPIEAARARRLAGMRAGGVGGRGMPEGAAGLAMTPEAELEAATEQAARLGVTGDPTNPLGIAGAAPAQRRLDPSGLAQALVTIAQLAPRAQNQGVVRDAGAGVAAGTLDMSRMAGGVLQSVGEGLGSQTLQEAGFAAGQAAGAGSSMLERPGVAFGAGRIGAQAVPVVGSFALGGAPAGIAAGAAMGYGDTASQGGSFLQSLAAGGVQGAANLPILSGPSRLVGGPQGLTGTLVDLAAAPALNTAAAVGTAAAQGREVTAEELQQAAVLGAVMQLGAKGIEVTPQMVNELARRVRIDAPGTLTPEALAAQRDALAQMQPGNVGRPDVPAPDAPPVGVDDLASLQSTVEPVQRAGTPIPPGTPLPRPDAATPAPRPAPETMSVTQLRTAAQARGIDPKQPRPKLIAALLAEEAADGTEAGVRTADQVGRVPDGQPDPGSVREVAGGVAGVVRDAGEGVRPVAGDVAARPVGAGEGAGAGQAADAGAGRGGGLRGGVGPVYDRLAESVGDRRLRAGTRFAPPEAAPAAIGELAARSGSIPGDKNVGVAFGLMDADEAREFTAQTGMPGAGRVHVVDSQAIRHVLKTHGEGAALRADEVPVRPEDFSRLPEITKPENIVVAQQRRGQSPSVTYRQRVNGYHYVVELASDRSGGSLVLKTMYKTKGGGESAEGGRPATDAAPSGRMQRPASDTAGTDRSAPSAENDTPPARPIAVGDRVSLPEWTGAPGEGKNYGTIRDAEVVKVTPKVVTVRMRNTAENAAMFGEFTTTRLPRDLAERGRSYHALKGQVDSYGRFDNNVPKGEQPARLEGAGLVADVVPARLAQDRSPAPGEPRPAERRSDVRADRTAPIETRRGDSDSDGTPGPRRGSPDVSQRLIDRLDAVEKAALERIKTRSIPRSTRPGQRPGASTLPGDVVDMAVVVAARAGKAGIKGGKALTEFTRKTIDELAPAMKDRADAVARAAGRLVKGSTDQAGGFDPDRFEAAVAATRPKPRAPKGAEVKRAVRDSTGQAPDPKTITEPQALAESMKAAQRTARQAWREATRTARAEARTRLSALSVRLRSKAAADRATREGLQAEAVRLARENLPPYVRGKLLPVIKNAKTLPGLRRAITAMVRELDAFEGRDQVRRAVRSVGRAVKKPDAQLLRDIYGALKGVKVDESTVVTRKSLRAALVEWQSAQRAALGGADAAAVQSAALASREVADTIAGKVHEFRRQNKVVLAGKVENARLIRDELRATVNAAATPRRVLAAARSAAEPLPDSQVRRFMRSQLTDDTIAAMIDGERDGLLHKVWVQDIWDGESRWHGRMRDAQNDLNDTVKRAGYTSLGQALAEISGRLGPSSHRTISVDLGTIQEISLGQALEILAADKTTGGRIEAGNPVTFRTRENTPVTVTPAAMEKIRQAVGDKHLRLVEDVAQLMAGKRQDDFFKALKDIKGWEPERVPWYFPTRRNMKHSAMPDKYPGWSGMIDGHLEDVGFTKNREGGKTPFVVGEYLDTVLHHLQMSAAIIELAEPVRTAEMVVLHPEMRPLLAAKFGDNVVQRIEDRLRAVSQLGTYHVHADFDRWVLRGTQNVSRALTSINPRSWLRQIGGVATLAADMPTRAFRDGLTALRNPREFSRAYTEMIEGSGFFWNRFAESPSAMMSGLGSASGPVVGGGVGRESVRAAGRALRRGRPVEAARSLARVFDAVRIATWFDSMASRVAYLGWKAEAARVHPDWPEASRRSWALSQAEASVRRTQNTFSVTDSSAMSQKARLSPAWAPFVSFTGDSNKSLNMLVQAAATGDRKRLAAAAAVRALNAAWGGVVTAGVPLAGYLLVSAATGNTAGRERAKDKAWSDMGMAALRDLAGTVLFGDKLLDLAIGARKSYSGGPFETAAGGTFADLAQGLGDIATGVRTAVEARAEEDPEKMDEAIGRFMRAAEKAALGGLTLSGVPVAPVYRLGRNASRAATATHSEDLMAEWKTLDAIPEERRTEAQADRLSDLQLFRRRRQRAIQKARKAREDGDHAGAREWEQEVEAIALEFIGPDRAERRAGLQR